MSDSKKKGAHGFAETYGGVKDNIFAFLIASLLFAGILSKILTASHLVSAMLWAATLIHLEPSMMPLLIFLLFIFFVVSLIREAGVLEAFLKAMRKFAKSDLTAEIAAGGMVSIMSIAISSGTSAITFCGPIIRGLLRPFKIDRARAANFLDGLGCGVGYLVPTNAGNMVLASLAVAAGAVKEGYNPIEFVVYNFHSMALVIVFWFAILSGWGRKHETNEELAADGIVIEPAL